MPRNVVGRVGETTRAYSRRRFLAILAGELPAKWAAEVASSSGHDLFGFTQGGAINVYNKQLVDVSDIAMELGKKHGDWVDPLASQLGKFSGAWKGVPDYFVDFPVM